MKFLALLCVSLACASGSGVRSPRGVDSDAPIVRSSYDISPEGAFNYAYETGNGIYAQADGSLKNANSEYPSIEIKGAVKYTSPEGVPVELSYIANEDGYQPQGNLLPVAPPVPEAILRSLKYIEDHPPRSQPNAFL